MAARSASFRFRVIRDRVAQGALKLILEPIFEADFQSGSFGYRPQRTACEAVDRGRERSFSTRRASSTSTCAAISTMSGMIGCWRK